MFAIILCTIFVLIQVYFLLNAIEGDCPILATVYGTQLFLFIWILNLLV